MLCCRIRLACIWFAGFTGTLQKQVAIHRFVNWLLIPFSTFFSTCCASAFSNRGIWCSASSVSQHPARRSWLIWFKARVLWSKEAWLTFPYFLSQTKSLRSCTMMFYVYVVSNMPCRLLFIISCLFIQSLLEQLFCKESCPSCMMEITTATPALQRKCGKSLTFCMRKGSSESWQHPTRCVMEKIQDRVAVTSSEKEMQQSDYPLVPRKHSKYS